MSIVVVDVENEYCDELMYSYQLSKEDDGTYSVYVARDCLRGFHAGRNLESFAEAFQLLNDTMKEHEGELV